MPGCADGIVYVSPSGQDSNSGCRPSAPKATIGGAIAYVKTLGLKGHEIHVCRGTYEEAGLVLDYPVSLRGGYECSLWTRREPFGFTGFDPTTGRAVPFDTTNASIVGATGAEIAFEVRDAAVTRDVFIEGLTIRGRSAGGGMAVRVRGGAAPVFKNDQIFGPSSGIGSLPDVGSIGVDVAEDAGPELVNCRIDGGGGGSSSDPRGGSVGLRLATSGAVLVHDCEIDGGRGVSKRVASFGVEVRKPTAITGERALARNSIFYSGVGGTTNDSGTFGVWTGPETKTDILENRVIGLSVKCASGQPNCAGYGVLAGSAQGVVARNRLFAGDATGSLAVVTLWGILVSGTDTLVSDNLVYLGVGPMGTYGIGVFPAATNVRVLRNTVHGHRTPSTYGVVTYGGSVSVDENLIVETAVGLATGDCVTATGATYRRPTSVRNNAFVGPFTLAQRFDNLGCNTISTAALPAELGPLLGPAASNDVFVVPTCNGASLCHACTSATTCGLDVLGAEPTLPSLLAGNWTLAPTASCDLAKGGLAASAGSLDALETPRTLPDSIGAREQDGTCATP